MNHRACPFARTPVPYLTEHSRHSDSRGKYARFSSALSDQEELLVLITTSTAVSAFRPGGCGGGAPDDAVKIGREEMVWLPWCRRGKSSRNRTLQCSVQKGSPEPLPLFVSGSAGQCTVPGCQVNPPLHQASIRLPSTQEAGRYLVGNLSISGASTPQSRTGVVLYSPGLLRAPRWS